MKMLYHGIVHISDYQMLLEVNATTKCISQSKTKVENIKI